MKVWNEKKEKNEIPEQALNIVGVSNIPKKAVIVVSLVPEASEVSSDQIEGDIRKTLQCDWLAKIEDVKIKK